MRIANTNPVQRGVEFTEEIREVSNISFTANAIGYLSSSPSKINLKEWIWHEEMINGIKYYIITDKVIKER